MGNCIPYFSVYKTHHHSLGANGFRWACALTPDGGGGRSGHREAEACCVRGPTTAVMKVLLLLGVTGELLLLPRLASSLTSLLSYQRLYCYFSECCCPFKADMRRGGGGTTMPVSHLPSAEHHGPENLWPLPLGGAAVTFSPQQSALDYTFLWKPPEPHKS